MDSEINKLQNPQFFKRHLKNYGLSLNEYIKKAKV